MDTNTTLRALRAVIRELKGLLGTCVSSCCELVFGLSLSVISIRIKGAVNNSDDIDAFAKHLTERISIYKPYGIDIFFFTGIEVRKWSMLESSVKPSSSKEDNAPAGILIHISFDKEQDGKAINNISVIIHAIKPLTDNISDPLPDIFFNGNRLRQSTCNNEC